MEFEGHPSVGVNGYRVDNDQPELFVKLGEGIQFLHLKHKCSDGFCLSFPCRLCGAELLKLCLGFFILLRKTVVSGLGCLTIAPAIQRFSGSLTITAEQKDAISIKRTKPLCRIAPQRGHLCAKTAEKPYIKRFSGIEKIHRNSIKITVDLCLWATKKIFSAVLRMTSNSRKNLYSVNHICDFYFIIRE